MLSITHLLSPLADEQTLQIHQMLTDGIGPGFSSRTKTIGPGGDYRNLAAAILHLRSHPADITCAWGIQALAAAVIARSQKILFLPNRFAGPRSLRWIRTLMPRADVTMICPTFTQHRIALANGIDPDRCRVIQPGVDFGRVRNRRDSVLRQKLGFGQTDIVVIAPGESTIQTNHKYAVWACSILHVLNPAYKLLLWGRGPGAASAAHLMHRLHQPALVALAQQTLGHPIQFEQLLGVADLCLVTSEGAIPTLPIAAVMAGGVPIVSTVNYMLAELLEDRHTALMVPKPSPRALVRRILDLQSDPVMKAKMTDTARAEAYEHFSMTRMLDEYRRAFTAEKLSPSSA